MAQSQEPSLQELQQRIVQMEETHTRHFHMMVAGIVVCVTLTFALWISLTRSDLYLYRGIVRAQQGQAEPATDKPAAAGALPVEAPTTELAAEVMGVPEVPVATK